MGRSQGGGLSDLSSRLGGTRTSWASFRPSEIFRFEDLFSVDAVAGGEGG